MYQTFQEPEDPGPGQVVKKENDREHKVFKVKLNLLIFMLFCLKPIVYMYFNELLHYHIEFTFKQIYILFVFIFQFLIF